MHCLPDREAQLSESILGALSTKIYAGICLLTVAVVVAVVVALLVTVIAVVVAVRVAIVVGIVVAADVAAALGQLEIISGRQ